MRMGHGQSARHARRTQRWLVTTEITLSVVLLVGAGLLTRSLWQLSKVDPGFRPAGLVVAKLTVPRDFYMDDARRLAYYEQTVARLRTLPGVHAASAGAYIPFAMDGSSSSAVVVEGRVYDDRNRPPYTVQRSVLPDYFNILGIPLRAGRVFTTEDRIAGEMVAIVSESAAKRDFPGEDPIGRRVGYQGKTRRIVGVVGDVHSSSLSRTPGPAIYVPLAQHVSGTVSFVIRSSQDVQALTPSIRLAVREFNPAVSLAAIERLPTFVTRSYAAERYRTVIVTVFALLATTLAAVGLYGVTLRAVMRRTREIGIRVALGATPGMATRLLMSDTVRGVAVGVVLGLPLALLVSERITGYLFQVSPSDSVVYTTVVVLLVSVALIASLLPARRAARTNPARVLSGD
jgi:predicted permease